MQINTWTYRPAPDWKALHFSWFSHILHRRKALNRAADYFSIAVWLWGRWLQHSAIPQLKGGQRGKEPLQPHGQHLLDAWGRNPTPDLTRDNFFPPEDVKQPSHCPNWAAGGSDFIFRKMESIYGIEKNSKYCLNDQMTAHSNSLLLPDRLFSAFFVWCFFTFYISEGICLRCWGFFCLAAHLLLLIIFLHTALHPNQLLWSWQWCHNKTVVRKSCRSRWIAKEQKLRFCDNVTYQKENKEENGQTSNRSSTLEGFPLVQGSI